MPNPNIVREVLDNDLRLVTERMTQVRSISIGVWVTRGSRHEPAERGGIAHFVEHMLFKGTTTRTAENIAQAIDSIGGQLDAFTGKEYAGYYIKVIDEHLPLAIDILTDMLRNPAFHPEDLEKERKVILEEIKMIEDSPDELIHELFTQSFWADHPLGRPILGTRETVESFDVDLLRDYFNSTYRANNLIVAAVGNLEHSRVRELIEDSFVNVAPNPVPAAEHPPNPLPQVVIKPKDLEQSHLCLGTSSYPQKHDDRYASYILHTLLGGSMSSRLFQNIREKRGLAYAVGSSLNAYRDAGSFTIDAGCANEAVGEVIDLVIEELRGLKQAEVCEAELRRSKDHLKGSLMLGLESTSGRMSHLARQEIYFDRQFGLDETLQGIEKVTAADVRRVATDFFQTDSLTVAVLGNVNGGLEIPRERLDLE